MYLLQKIAPRFMVMALLSVFICSTAVAAPKRHSAPRPAPVAAQEIPASGSVDLLGIKRALHSFLPNETIGVEMVNKAIALTGNISGADTAQKAMKIAKEYVPADAQVLNFMQIKTGQQVMLRVRVGEIQRTALKRIGFNLQGVRRAGDYTIPFATGGGIGQAVGSAVSDSQAFGVGSIIYNSTNLDLSATLDMLEQNGLFKMLAEPNLVAVSGESASFLAGGEFPVPIAQYGDTISVDYKPFGVKVGFSPLVLSANRIRLNVEPEVSEISAEGAVQIKGFTIPSVTSRRAKTTVELAPGESFMIAGLIKDDFRTTINQVPGVGDIPVLSALFRSAAFQRNETELVIAVTPYIADPVASDDVRLPTDNFHTPSVLEGVFLGALSSRTATKNAVAPNTQGLEGPVGYIAE